MSQDKLVRRFAAGDDHGTASNMQIRPADGGTELVGYGWARYAFRTDDGTVTIYEGWNGYSISTTQQMTKVRRVADEADDSQPRAGSRAPEDARQAA